MQTHPKRILYLGLDPTHYPCQGELIHWPIIQIVPRPLSDPALYQALSNFLSYSHLIVTSKSTVAILQEYLPLLGFPLQTWTQKLTLAVGKVTAKHLEACGIAPIRVAQEETAEGIIDELKQLSLKNAHVFWPHSAQSRPLIKEFLITQNIDHTTCVLYEPQPRASLVLCHKSFRPYFCVKAPRLSDRKRYSIKPIQCLLRSINRGSFHTKNKYKNFCDRALELPCLESFDEIVFTSPSTVKAFLQIFEKFPSHAKLVAIGPMTARDLVI